MNNIFVFYILLLVFTLININIKVILKKILRNKSKPNKNKITLAQVLLKKAFLMIKNV